jgi:hypothetical protein
MEFGEVDGLVAASLQILSALSALSQRNLMLADPYTYFSGKQMGQLYGRSGNAVSPEPKIFVLFRHWES